MLYFRMWLLFLLLSSTSFKVCKYNLRNIFTGNWYIYNYLPFVLCKWTRLYLSDIILVCVFVNFSAFNFIHFLISVKLLQLRWTIRLQDLWWISIKAGSSRMDFVDIHWNLHFCEILYVCILVAVLEIHCLEWSLQYST